ncbi:glycosyltransferase [Microbacterium sp. cx-59]|uniref:glycosyltransferase n=1 Tax=Microbacterium sp. cx-59 TaxID=2891207 RepID=UPI001E5A8062|nr:glycosyltransferase [Microbacterium sp. cx-59]MCC4907853.1 glycosyltransferase [Microbacterium sp. cx-59]
MTVSLRVVLDQLVDVVDADVAEAETQIARALVATAPRGCVVEAIVPAGSEGAVPDAAAVAEVTKAPLTRAKLSAAWQLGIAPGLNRGLIHAPSLMAPLVRHDRVNDNDQTVITVWDLCAWEVPDAMPRGAVAWHRSMVKRAEKYADAVIVPAHALAERLSEASPKLHSRIRVIPGAAPLGFAVPSDAVGRRRELMLPDELIVLAAGRCDDAALAAGLAAIASLGDEHAVVVLDIAEGGESRVEDLAAAAGLRAEVVHSRASLSPADRAAVFGAALAVVAPSALTAFPWRVVDAMALGVPVVAIASPIHQEILLDGGSLAPAEGLGEALAEVLSTDANRRRASVRAADRGSSFSWRDHAERVWALHAEL